MTESVLFGLNICAREISIVIYSDQNEAHFVL